MITQLKSVESRIKEQIESLEKLNKNNEFIVSELTEMIHGLENKEYERDEIPLLSPSVELDLLFSNMRDSMYNIETEFNGFNEEDLKISDESVNVIKNHVLIKTEEDIKTYFNKLEEMKPSYVSYEIDLSSTDSNSRQKMFEMLMSYRVDKGEHWYKADRILEEIFPHKFKKTQKKEEIKGIKMLLKSYQDFLITGELSDSFIEEADNDIETLKLVKYLYKKMFDISTNHLIKTRRIPKQ